MIKSFGSKETLRLWQQDFVKNIPKDIQNRALHKLVTINNAQCLEDLRVPPGNHLEKLIGDRLGQYSIKVQKQYRICFEYYHGDFYNVEIVDYH